MAYLHVDFFSDVLGMCTSMNVILPQKTRGMIGIDSAETDGRYPTLFLLHGMSDDHTTWMRRTSIERYAEEAGIAVVMPTTHLGWYTDMKCGFNYRTFIGDELVKICRSFFPGMSPRREDTYLSGNSMGGYGSLAIALTYPETFSAAAPLSGALLPGNYYGNTDEGNLGGRDRRYWTDIFGEKEDFYGSVNDLEFLAKKRAEDGSPLPKVYQWCGTEDFLYQDNLKMRDCLTSLGYSLTYEESTGNHSWNCWDIKIQSVLKWLRK